MIANNRTVYNNILSCCLSLVDRCCLCQCTFCLFPCLLWICGFGWGGDGCSWWAVAGGWCLASLRVRVRESLCLFVVWCRVMSCVARRCSLFFSFVTCRHLSLVVDCLSLCCALLFCVVFGLCCVVCVVVCVWGGGIEHATRVYVKNALRVYQHHAHMFRHVGLVAGTHGVFQRVTAHTTPHHTAHTTTTTTQPQPQTHTTTTHNQPDNNAKQPTCGSICLNTDKITRS